MIETEFQALYEGWSKTQPDTPERNAIWEKVHYYVYSYAKKRFKASDDDAADFYLYVYSRIESIFSNYKPEYQILFFIFFSVKLRGMYLNFVDAVSRKNEYVLFRTFVDGEQDLLISPLSALEPSSHEREQREKLYAVLQQLPIFDEITLRMAFGFPLAVRHFRMLLKKNGASIFKDYREYLKFYCRKSEVERTKRNKIMERINMLTIRKLRNADHSPQDATIQELIQQYHKPKRVVSHNVISRILGIRKNSLSIRLKKAIDSLRKKLQTQEV